MDRKFLIAWAVVFVVWTVGGFVIHGLLLASAYAELPDLLRPEAEAQRYFVLMLLAHVIMAGAFVWIYQRGQEDKPWLAQGMRFGIAVALLTVVPWYTIYFVVQPWPASVVVQQIIYDGILVLIVGAVTAFLCKTA